jgi:signal peptidase I
MRQFLISALEVVEVALVAIGAVFLIRTFLVQPFLVSGASMVPNFANGDYLLVDELSYRFRGANRGEVVVFRYPKDESTYFIKRVIGVPGDRIEIKENKVLIYNTEHQDGMALAEPYLSPDTPTVVRSGGQDAFTLAPEEYLVLGDNRSYSFDSRDWRIRLTNSALWSTMQRAGSLAPLRSTRRGGRPLVGMGS